MNTIWPRPPGGRSAGEAVSGTDSAGGQGPAGRLPLLLEAWAVLHDAARLGYGTAALLPANVLYPAQASVAGNADSQGQGTPPPQL